MYMYLCIIYVRICIFICVYHSIPSFEVVIAMAII